MTPTRVSAPTTASERGFLVELKVQCPNRVRAMPVTARSPLLALLLALVGVSPAFASGCAPPGVWGGGWGAVAFDTAQVWILSASDSVSLEVEVAETDRQQEVGLRDRISLNPGAGMLFLLDVPRSGDDGFWMWRTRIPLDIAFLDQNGRILAILGMEPCPGTDPTDCPEHAPGVDYMAALEVNRGWFLAQGVGVGDRIRVER